ncbi:hypothetical protein NMY22_g19978 [Coprinellus aureogranulatus]|nr:hypothetical protein NMY22_g19978 [Coprinellus aureogranulatus]
MASSRLPAEVLSRIFSVLASSSVIDVKDFGRARNPSWISVCHVCRHWREAALDCASLWTDLMFHKPGLSEFMLANTKGCPLTVEFNVFNQEIEPFIDILRQAISQAHRLQSLIVRREDVMEQKLYLSRIVGTGCTEAPILEKLVISRDAQQRTEETLPEGFLSKGAPALRHLNLTGFNVGSWGSIPLGAGLTFLKLHAPIDSTLIRPDPATFFSALSSMDSLATLSLLKTAPDDALQSSSQYTLPSTLQKLNLEDTAELVNQFLRSVAVPGTAKLAVTFIDLQGDEALGEFIDLLELSWNSDIRAGVYGFDYMPYDGERSRLKFALNEQSLNPNLDVSFMSSAWAQAPTLNIDDAFSLFNEQLNFSTLITLKIWQEHTWDAATWRTMFAQLPDLCLVELHRNALFGFLGALQEEWNQPGNTTTALFPSLLWVKCHEIDFDKRLGRLHGLGDTFGCLVEMAKRFTTRYKFRLGLKECTDFGPEELKRLKEAAPGLEVIWDGSTFFADPWSSDEEDDEQSSDDEDGILNLILVHVSQSTWQVVAVYLSNAVTVFSTFTIGAAFAGSQLADTVRRPCLLLLDHRHSSAKAAFLDSCPLWAH